MQCIRWDELMKNENDKKKYEQQLDVLGQESSMVQELRQPITSVTLLYEVKSRQEKHRVYVLLDHGDIFGYLKVGLKHLYYAAKSGFMEIDPLCLLDFYVQTQRQGHGLLLFQYMLDSEKQQARNLAFDRPSPKLYPFLNKHFGLVDYVPQSNRFVVFDAYFK
ncbi:hypothetical protein THRCLA_06444 [Thraustotheca clavata]|uniref:N-acetyltransferase domain-containing protein n=1 Tax=Thraustotheca clavata TaxID=74557 RepID=A0A1V9ZNN6_9STRA|nr:hypothetical protein THRCLA_06444 [Thraustotheca clavata]